MAGGRKAAHAPRQGSRASITRALWAGELVDDLSGEAKCVFLGHGQAPIYVDHAGFGAGLPAGPVPV
jgi:hypothetical protein